MLEILAEIARLVARYGVISIELETGDKYDFCADSLVFNRYNDSEHKVCIYTAINKYPTFLAYMYVDIDIITYAIRDVVNARKETDTTKIRVLNILKDL